MKKQVKMRKDDINLEELRLKLKWGHYSKIGKKLGKTPQCISHQFRGKTKAIKPDVIKAAIEVLSEEKETNIELNKLIKSV